jgi:hypothetical protein
MVRFSHHDMGFHGWNAACVTAHNTTKFYVMLTADPVLNIVKEGISPYGPATHSAIRVVSPRKTTALRRHSSTAQRAIRAFVALFVDGCALTT